MSEGSAVPGEKVSELPRFEVGVVFHPMGWRCVEEETADSTKSTLTAFGWLQRDSWTRWSSPALVCGSEAPLDSADCHVTILLRTDNATPPAATGANATDSPSRPTGWMSWWSGEDDRPGAETISATVHLGAEPFGELVRRRRIGLPMPVEIRMLVTDIEVRKQPKARGYDTVAVLTSRDHPITSLNWEYAPSRQTGMRPESIVPPAVVRQIAAIDWKHAGWMTGHHQFRHIVGELMASAVIDVVQGRSGFERLEGRLLRAWEMAESFYRVLVDGERQRRRDLRDLKIKRDREDAHGVPWTKRHPMSDFNEGKRSYSWTGVAKGELADIAGEYLGSDLISPALEWALVDALCYAEIREFGEVVKQRIGGVNPLDLLSSDYHKTGGNIVRMALRKGMRHLPLALGKGFFWYLVPGFLAFAWFSEGHVERALLAVGVWAAAVTMWPHFLKGLGFGGAEKRAGLVRQGELMEAMAGAYALVNRDQPPGVVLRQLGTAADKGAVWDGPVSSILLRAEDRNRAAWALDNATYDLARAITERLREARDAAAKATEFELPDYDAAPSPF